MLQLSTHRYDAPVAEQVVLIENFYTGDCGLSTVQCKYPCRRIACGMNWPAAERTRPPIALVVCHVCACRRRTRVEDVRGQAVLVNGFIKTETI